MQLLITILLILGAVCFLLYALGYPNPPARRLNLLGLGLFFWELCSLIPRLAGHAIILAAVFLSCSCTSTETTFEGKTTKVTAYDPATTAEILKSANQVVALGAQIEELTKKGKVTQKQAASEGK